MSTPVKCPVTLFVMPEAAPRSRIERTEALEVAGGGLGTRKSLLTPLCRTSVPGAHVSSKLEYHHRLGLSSFEQADTVADLLQECLG